MDGRKRSWLLALGLATVSVLLAPAARADVLVTTKGARFEGTVTQEGDRYKLVRPSGTKLYFPQRVVAEVIRTGSFRAQFPAKFAAARGNPKRLEELAKWCKTFKLAEETKQCLEAQYEARKAAATTPQAKWEVARWCGGWKMTGWRDEQRLAAIRDAATRSDLACLGRFLKRLQGDKKSKKKEKGRPDGAQLTCLQAIYGVRLKADKGNASALVKLADWCRLHQLAQEAKEAEAAALAIDPNDEETRHQLGYVKDTATGRWVIPPTPWRVRVGSARLTPVYTETRGADTLTAKPTVAGGVLAAVEVKFRALTPSPGAARDLKAVIDKLPAKAKALANMMEVPPDMPARLFTTAEVPLTLADGRRIHATFTSAAAPGSGITITSNTINVTLIGKEDRTQPRYLRMGGVTVVAVPPRQTITLTLLYTVPRGTRTATLRFYRNAPITVRF